MALGDRIGRRLIWAVACALGLALTQGAGADDAPARQPRTLQEAEAMMFGSAEDIAFARRLWRELLSDRLVGADPRAGTPREGVPPHGTWLEVFFTEATIENQTGALIVKRDYGPEKPSLAELTQRPEAYLRQITVMYRRAPGWDPAVQDWFWAEYTPEGTLTETASGTVKAGAVGKNLNTGCAACHIAAAGNDFVFTGTYPRR